MAAPAQFTVGQSLTYLGDRDVAPVNRTIAAPYGGNEFVVSFRRHLDNDHAEVMTTRGSRNVPVAMLEVTR